MQFQIAQKQVGGQNPNYFCITMKQALFKQSEPRQSVTTSNCRLESMVGQSSMAGLFFLATKKGNLLTTEQVHTSPPSRDDIRSFRDREDSPIGGRKDSRPSLCVFYTHAR